MSITPSIRLDLRTSKLTWVPMPDINALADQLVPEVVAAAMLTVTKRKKPRGRPSQFFTERTRRELDAFLTQGWINGLTSPISILAAQNFRPILLDAIKRRYERSLTDLIFESLFDITDSDPKLDVFSGSNVAAIETWVRERLAERVPMDSADQSG